MTAAQVVTTRAPSAPPPAKDNAAAARQAGQNSGFEDTLDRADAANAEVSSDASAAADEAASDRAQSHDAGRQSSSARGHARGGDAEALDDTTTEPSADASAANQITLAQVPAFALALAALSVSSLDPQVQPEGLPVAQTGEPISNEAVLKAILGGSGNEPDADMKTTQGLDMPGKIDPLAETLSLLGISDDDAAEVEASANETTVKVLGRETHLAVSQKAPDSVQAYSSQLDEAAAVQAAAQAAPGPKTTATTAPANDAEEAGKSTAAGSPTVTGEQASVPAASVFSNEGDGSSDSSTSGQERRQADANAQQISSTTQGSLPAGVQPGTAPGVRTGATETTPGSYADSFSPASQIARSVTAEIAASNRSGSNTDGVLKVLHIELQPQNLGSVTVRMSLKDDVISLHMETSRHETAAAIEKERSALTSALKSSGYVVDEITTQATDGLRVGGARIEAATNDASMSSFAQGDGRSQAQQEFSNPGRGQGGQRNSGGDVSLTPSKSTGDGADEMSRPRTGAIYV